MSMTTTYTCDHCGGACSGRIYASLWDDGDETKGYKHTRLDGCTQEHLGLVVAKSFGMRIDATTFLLVTQKNEALNAARIDELEKRLAEQNAPVSADGKTPGQVLYERWDLAWNEAGTSAPHSWNTLSEQGKHWRERAAQAVLRAFGNGAKALQRVRGALLENSHPCDGDGGYQVIDTEDAITLIDDEFAKLSAPANPNEPRTIVVRKGDKIVFEGEPLQEPEGGWLRLNALPTDHVHELGSCTHCDTQGITDPQKPTRPLHARIGSLLARWKANEEDQDHPLEYRNAIGDCVSELQSTMDGVDWS